MASTRSCGCRFRFSFSLFVQSPIHSIVFATTFAGIALGQTTPLGFITSPLLPTSAVLVTSQPAVVTRAPSIPEGINTTFTTGSKTTLASSSNQVSQISVFITVTTASSTPAATSPSSLLSVESKKNLGVGIGLGVLALCLLIILAIWLIFCHNRKKRASGEGNIPFIAEIGSQPMKNNKESELPSELPDTKPALSELAEGRESPLPHALRTELPNNSAPLAEMRGY